MPLFFLKAIITNNFLYLSRYSDYIHAYIHLKNGNKLLHTALLLTFLFVCLALYIGYISYQQYSSNFYMAMKYSLIWIYCDVFIQSSDWLCHCLSILTTYSKAMYVPLSIFWEHGPLVCKIALETELLVQNISTFYILIDNAKISFNEVLPICIQSLCSFSRI